MTNDAVLKIIEQAAADGRQELELSRKGLTELPKEIYKLKNLTKLDLGFNQISEISEAITELKNLTTLDLVHNKISVIPDTITKLKNLTEINLSRNQISEIPDTITKLKNLKMLYLGLNKISEIPETITELQSLTELDLSSNQTSKIPEAIAELKNLTILDLSNNKISEIPEAITKLKNLTTLYLSNNEISEIPEAITKLKNLTMLYLGFNQISEIPDTITELKNLTTLDLSGNEISEIPGAITKLKYLKELELGHNPIEFPPSYIIEAGVQSIGDYYDYVNNVILVRYREQNPLQIERSIEFLPEYWTAGNSILSYFSHILSVKYPNQNIKVKIEQEGLLLRMIIDTPEGTTETIEKAFNDYVMVISRKLPPESLLTDPFEVMALKNKLENAELELRQTQKLFADKDRQRIESLEMQVSQLNSLNSQFYGLFSKMIENFPHNPIYMNQFTNHNQNANIANQANQINDHGQQNANHFNQNQDKNTAEILKIINNLRQITSQFPPQNQEDILIDLEDVETELQKPESDRNLPKLKKRLMALLTASTIIAAPVANLTDFTNNITDLAQKAGIGLLH